MIYLPMLMFWFFRGNSQDFDGQLNFLKEVSSCMIYIVDSKVEANLLLKKIQSDDKKCVIIIMDADGKPVKQNNCHILFGGNGKVNKLCKVLNDKILTNFFKWG